MERFYMHRLFKKSFVIFTSEWFLSIILAARALRYFDVLVGIVILIFSHEDSMKEQVCVGNMKDRLLIIISRIAIQDFREDTVCKMTFHLTITIVV